MPMHSIKIIHKLINKIIWQTQNLFLGCTGRINGLFHRYQETQNILICGSGRSGTTWLAELFSNIIDNATLVNEPLHINNSKKLMKIGFDWNQHIPESCQSWQAANLFFNHLFSGQELNPNYFYYNKKTSVIRIPFTKYWIHKFVRIHLLLPWIVNHYQVRKPIYLIRHPFAVIASQLKSNDWDPTLNRFPFPKVRYSQVFEPYRSIMKKVKTNEPYLAVEWCLTNKYLLTHRFHNQKWLTVAYEHLLQNPKDELRRISNGLGIAFTKGLPGEQIFAPSGSTKENSLIREGFSPSKVDQQLTDWQGFLSPHQKALIHEILLDFDISVYHKDKIEPEDSLFALNNTSDKNTGNAFKNKL
ncbi:MAG: hypothetical protein OHK0053_24830 [Microscillaceae bacterium]